MADPFQPPTAALDQLQPTKQVKPKRSKWVFVAALLCFGCAGLLGVDLVTFLVTKSSRVLEAIVGQRPFRAYERGLIIEQVANVVCGTLALVAGGCFWTNRRLAALIAILLGVLAVVAVGWALAGVSTT